MKKKKNLIIITPDQMRYDYLGCYGHPDIGTKHLDQLASDGVLLESCYCAAPLCGPSRISFTTSTYFSEHNHRNYWSTISPDVPNLVTQIKNAGYVTGMFGKNHLFTYERLPEVWDELDEICLGNYDGLEEYRHAFSSFTLPADHPFNITGRLTDEALDFMKRRKDEPFFVWVNYQDPHPAFTCPAPYDTMFNPEDIELDATYYKYDADKQPARNEVWRVHSEMDLCTDMDLKQAIAHYMGQIRYVDDSVGRIMNFLNETGLEEETIVLFFSDHGELLGSYNMTHKIPVFYDCLTRIPAILRYPGKYRGVRFKGLVEEVDLAPTLLDLMDIEIPETMVGCSLAGNLERGRFEYFKESALSEAGGGGPTWKEPVKGLKLLAPHLPTSLGPGAMVRKENYKLSVYADDKCELYDLEHDPDELENLFENPAMKEVRAEMILLLTKRLLSVKIRDTGNMEWNSRIYPQDVRFEPLELCSVGKDVEDENSERKIRT